MKTTPSVRMTVVVGVAAVMVAGGCGGKSGHDAASNSPAETPLSTANPNGEVSRSIGKMTVTATPSSGSRVDLVVAEGDTPAGKAFEAQVAASPAVRLTNRSGGQPSAPVTVRFDLSDNPSLANVFSETVKPVVRSLSEDDPQATDLLAASWDPASRTVTATTPHLSIFQVIAVDVGNVWNAATAALKQTVSGEDSPCRDKSEITIGSSKLTLTPSKPGPVAGCLREGDGGSVGVDFTNRTHQYFNVISTPAGQFANPTWLGSDDVIATWLHQSDSSAGLLTPTSTGNLTLPTSTTSAQIHLDVDPISLQIKTLLTGLGMLGVDGDAVINTLLTSKDGWDCLATAGKVVNSPAPGSVDEFRNTLGDIAQCGLSASQRVVGDSRNYLLHRMSVAVSLLTSLPDQLLANVTGAIGELTGDNHLIFTLASEEPSTPSTGSSPAKSVIDRVDITTWAYDRVLGDTYRADNIGGKKIEVFWKSFAGAEQVRSGCTSTVRIQGPGTDKTKEESNCDSYDPGTYLDVHSPGAYTVTVTVRQEGQPDITAQRTVTIVPH